MKTSLDVWGALLRGRSKEWMCTVSRKVHYHGVHGSNLRAGIRSVTMLFFEGYKKVCHLSVVVDSFFLRHSRKTYLSHAQVKGVRRCYVQSVRTE
jgi:hypothetical protein